MRDSPSTDEDFTAFVAARSPALYRSAWLLTTSAPAAEDLVQSALAKAFVHWRKVQAADDPVAYVHGIVLKTFLSNRRRRSSGEIPVDATPDRPSSDRDPIERLALMAALRTLPPLDRAVVVLRYWEDRSVEETAHALHLSPAAVKNRSMRALARLRQTLSDPELHELASTKARHDSH
jgi:RNA polymerase sigma-70 factor (sigma-E family)